MEACLLQERGKPDSWWSVLPLDILQYVIVPYLLRPRFLLQRTEASTDQDLLRNHYFDVTPEGEFQFYGRRRHGKSRIIDGKLVPVEPYYKPRHYASRILRYEKKREQEICIMKEFRLITVHQSGVGKIGQITLEERDDYLVDSTSQLIYVQGKGVIYQLDYRGKLLRCRAHPQLEEYEMAISPDGFLFLYGTQSHLLLQLDPSTLTVIKEQPLWFAEMPQRFTLLIDCFHHRYVVGRNFFLIISSDHREHQVIEIPVGEPKYYFLDLLGRLHVIYPGLDTIEQLIYG